MADKHEESLKEAAQKWIKQRKCKEVKWKRQTLKSDRAGPQWSLLSQSPVSF